jgi:hypothetical protein
MKGNMKINSELKAFLVRLKERVPAAKREEFARNMRTHLEAIELDDLAGYVIAGSVIGAICELLPLDTVTGVADGVEIGAALGALIGYARTSQQRRLRKQLQDIIEQELRHALA